MLGALLERLLLDEVELVDEFVLGHALEASDSSTARSSTRADGD